MPKARRELTFIDHLKLIFTVRIHILNAVFRAIRDEINQLL